MPNICTTAQHPAAIIVVSCPVFIFEFVLMDVYDIFHFCYHFQLTVTEHEICSSRFLVPVFNEMDQH
jgi:hypothetical protein